MHSKTSINRTCLKRRLCWEGQTRLIPSVFYMLPFHAFIKPWRYTAKAKTVERTLLQKVNFFQSPDKRSHLPRSRELNWTFLSIFSKRNFLYTFKHTIFLIYSFEAVWYFWVEPCIFFSDLLSSTKQQLFYVTEWDILRPGKDLQTMLSSSGNYWF